MSVLARLAGQAIVNGTKMAMGANERRNSQQTIRNVFGEMYRDWNQKEQNALNVIDEYRDRFKSKYYDLLSVLITDPDFNFESLCKEYIEDIFTAFTEDCDKGTKYQKAKAQAEKLGLNEHKLYTIFAILMSSMYGKKPNNYVKEARIVDREFYAWFYDFQKDVIRSECMATDDFLLKKVTTDYWYPYLQLKLAPDANFIKGLFEDYRITREQAIKALQGIEYLESRIEPAKRLLLLYPDVGIPEDFDIEAENALLDDEWTKFDDFPYII